ncbi:uncharacterized protein H6S33_001703 [Morchella sextelata]|uniref:uncharacterized protein n=1 Tax=Morchella sextelata TaxID=1174677 RepID=UPI001D037CB7|nr:uncharacterized protein H6S33_001703 [Morchella sextelata]KAH0608569.1 hypothetical protein H6S33_001703 [Morchella sextelata]
MASNRITASVIRRCLAASRSIAIPSRIVTHTSLRPSLQIQPKIIQVSWGTIRHHSTPAPESKVYGYDHIKSFSAKPSANRLLVDVREPNEFRNGAIPTAINVPIATAPEAWSLPEDEFEDRFGFPKPQADIELVFYCKAGVRSSAAAQLALQNGYEKVGEYRGSWLDWEKRTIG